MKPDNRREPNEIERAAAERIKRLWLAKKKELGLSQATAAEASGWSQGVFNRYLNAKMPLNASAVLKFSRLLKVPSYDLAPEIIGQNPVAVDDILNLDDSIISSVSAQYIRSIAKNASKLSEYQLKKVDLIVREMVELLTLGDGLPQSKEGGNTGTGLSSSKPLYTTLSKDEIAQRLVDIMREKSIFQEPAKGVSSKQVSSTTTELIVEDREVFLQAGSSIDDFMTYAENEGLLPKDRLDPLHSRLLGAATTLNARMLKTDEYKKA